ncbi:hypothetical protein M011DRAFT_51588 [Sporormia fimetaria CBS 119925]|uniref:Uncharacterized protein n=1 Tax=Sporormia fimetaria CBS 119925 TaxID=1340428 RepID=A0A6A6VBW5_9PLEO|nr:hypothetical protein M011DRAFT_51588 [Sporormia fimetaria CBS 119925]
MADSLCGPSNALQNFQKHTSVDRTLQQDRLTSRQSPTQGFRSSPGPNPVLDSEFDAFQAGHAPPPQPAAHFQPPSFAAPRFAQASQAPDWANDFQRLNLNAPQHIPQQHHQPQAPQAASTWHQDFMRQQAPAPQASTQQHTMFGGIPRQTMGWSGQAFQSHTPLMSNTAPCPMSQTAQGKQAVFDDVPQFDDAAFERAFEQAQQDAMEEAQEMMEAETTQDQRPSEMERYHDFVSNATNNMEILTETDAIPVRDHLAYAIRPVNALREALSQNDVAAAENWLETLESYEKDGLLFNLGTESHYDDLMTGWQAAISQAGTWKERYRLERLLHATTEWRMSSRPLFGPHLESPAELAQRNEEAPQQQQQQQQQQQTAPDRDAEELAQTAGLLLEKVADNTSEKFKNSQFLNLMRRLRDHEVKVVDDKMVEVNAHADNKAEISEDAVDGAQLRAPCVRAHGACECEQCKRGLEYYQTELMRLELQNKKRLRMARQEQEMARYVNTQPIGSASGARHEDAGAGRIAGAEQDYDLFRHGRPSACSMCISPPHAP